MVSYVSRAQWGARKAKAAYSLVPSQVKNTAFHYPGTANPINAVGDAGFRRVCSALRGWQTYHMDTRGWSDIAYCVAVDQVGRAYTLRGINIRSAANGGTEVNLEYGAILLVLGNNEAPSAAMEATSRAVMQDYRVRFSRIPRRPTWHGAIRPGGTASDPSTDCPGKLTIAQIKAGKFDAGTTPTQPPVPEDDMSDADVQKINGYTEQVSIQIQKHIDQVLPVELAKALAADNDLATQIADVYTPEEGDTKAATTLLTYTAPRAAALVVQQLQPALDAILARLEAIEAK